MKVDHPCRHGGSGTTSVISRSRWKVSEFISIFHQLENESLLPVFVRLGFGSENLSIYGEKPEVCSKIVQEKGRDFQPLQSKDTFNTSSSVCQSVYLSIIYQFFSEESSISSFEPFLPALEQISEPLV